MQYATKWDDIPTVSVNHEGMARPAMVPIWLFSFASDAGLTGAPELEKSRLLLGLICAYGFNTSDEVLKVRFPAASWHCVGFMWGAEADHTQLGEIHAGQVLYLKGQLRVVTVLALLAVVHQRRVSLVDVAWPLPELYS